jgi:head-tail adaptor
MKSGPRDRRIIIEAPTITLDDYGGEDVTWGVLATRWASVVPVRDRERFANAETEASITHRFEVLYDQTLWTNLDPKCRIIFDNRYHEIVAVKEIGTRVGIEISATARAERVGNIDVPNPPFEPATLVGGDGIDITGNRFDLDIEELPLAPTG